VRIAIARVVRVGQAAAATVAVPVLAQSDRRAFRTQALDEVGRGEDALVLVPAADGDERQLGSTSWPSVLLKPRSRAWRLPGLMVV